MSAEFQYCTEAILHLKQGKNKASVVASLTEGLVNKGMAGSLGVVQAPSKSGDGDLCKIHLHTNEPQLVFDILRDR